MQSNQSQLPANPSPLALHHFFQTLQAHLPPQPTPFAILEEAFFNGYSQQEKDQAMQLLDYWNTMDLHQLLIEQFTTEDKIKLYVKNEILSARIFNKVKEFIYNLQYKKIDPNILAQLKGIEQFGDYLRRQQLKMSYDYTFWNKQGFKTHNTYHYSNVAMSNFKAEEERNISQEVYRWIANTKVQFLLQLQKFLTDIGFWSIHPGTESFNSFMRKLSRLNRGQQKEMFIRNMTVPNLQLMKQCNSKEYKWDSQEGQKGEEELEKTYPNYYFYKNISRKCKKFKNIAELHSKYQEYDFLEGRHDYIQWMFPNHYGSNFNSHSHPLNYIETILFLSDLEIGINMLRSILLFLDFVGLALNLETLELSVVSQERLKDVVLVNYHNHLRIMRLLACCPVVGYRHLTLKLVNLLDSLTQKDCMLEQQRKTFQNSWLVYGDHPDNKAKEMCFHQFETFPQDHVALKHIQKHLHLLSEKESKVEPKIEVADLDTLELTNAEKQNQLESQQEQK